MTATACMQSWKMEEGCFGKLTVNDGFYFWFEITLESLVLVRVVRSDACWILVCWVMNVALTI